MEDFFATVVAFIIFGAGLFVFFFLKEMFKREDKPDDEGKF